LADSIYTEGTYLEHNPTWHVEDSAWKVDQILAMLARHPLQTRTVAEVGCGAGEILRLLHDRLDGSVDYVGYEVSPQAFELAKARTTERLRFELRDAAEDRDAHYDLILIMDVIEHLDDPYAFLRGLRGMCDHMLLHIPLDLSALSVARPHVLLESRRDVGHINYYVKETALKTVEDSGYVVVDSMYTDSSATPATSRERVLQRAREALRRVSPELAAHLLGGNSLLVLARPA
jgi:SAM-dependent methyltransferase